MRKTATLVFALTILASKSFAGSNYEWANIQKQPLFRQGFGDSFNPHDKKDARIYFWNTFKNLIDIAESTIPNEFKDNSAFSKKPSELSKILIMYIWSSDIPTKSTAFNSTTPAFTEKSKATQNNQTTLTSYFVIDRIFFQPSSTKRRLNFVERAILTVGFQIFGPIQKHLAPNHYNNKNVLDLFLSKLKENQEALNWITAQTKKDQSSQISELTKTKEELEREIK